jgi:hypothetical protein
MAVEPREATNGDILRRLTPAKQEEASESQQPRTITQNCTQTGINTIIF